MYQTHDSAQSSLSTFNSFSQVIPRNHTKRSGREETGGKPGRVIANPGQAKTLNMPFSFDEYLFLAGDKAAASSQGQITVSH